MPQPFTNCTIGNLTSVFACANTYAGNLFGLGITFVIYIVFTTWLLVRGFKLNEVLPTTAFVMFLLTMFLRVMLLVGDAVPVFFFLMTIVMALVVRDG